MTYKTQGIIAKCLKQFDLRLFEEIGGNIQKKKIKIGRRKQKKALLELSLRELINFHKSQHTDTIITQLFMKFKPLPDPRIISEGHVTLINS